LVAANGSPRKKPYQFQKYADKIHAAACKAFKSGKYFNPDGRKRKYSGLKKLLPDLNIANKLNKKIFSLALLEESSSRDAAVTKKKW